MEQLLTTQQFTGHKQSFVLPDTWLISTSEDSAFLHIISYHIISYQDVIYYSVSTRYLGKAKHFGIAEWEATTRLTIQTIKALHIASDLSNLRYVGPSTHTMAIYQMLSPRVRFLSSSDLW